MTSKFVGHFQLASADEANTSKQLVKVEGIEKLPPKTEWHNYSIWEFNGKRYRPVTQKAIDGLENLVKQFSDLGYTKAIKDGKRKPSSVKYAICTFGVEDFKIVK